MDNRGRQGYEYSYRISTTNDNTMIPEEVIRRLRSSTLDGINTCVIEIRTNFILGKTKTSVAAAADDDDDLILDSEKLCVVHAAGDEWNTQGTMSIMSVRLKEYGMAEDQIRELTTSALDFANRLPPPARTRGTPFRKRVTPVLVEIEVRTVRREGEGLGGAMDRAIWVDSLFPLFGMENYVPSVENYVASVLNRRRVQDADEGLSLMETCPICLRNPTAAAQITILPRCKHAFHYHCVAGWLVKNNSCPLCRERVYRFDDKTITQEEMDEIRDFIGRAELKLLPN